MPLNLRICLNLHQLDNKAEYKYRYTQLDKRMVQFNPTNSKFDELFSPSNMLNLQLDWYKSSLLQWKSLLTACMPPNRSQCLIVKVLKDLQGINLKISKPINASKARMIRVRFFEIIFYAASIVQKYLANMIFF